MQNTPIPAPIPLPPRLIIPEPVVKQPVWKHPEWEPVPIYREDIPEEPKPKTEPKEKTEEEPTQKPASGKPMPKPEIPELAEVQTFNIPIINKEIPVPRAEILVTATTTAGVSSVAAVGGTLLATTMFRQLQPILKPIFKTLLKKLAAIRKKPPPLSFARERLLARRQRKLGKKAMTGGS